MSTFDYSVFDLRVRSSLELPELFPAPRAAAPDVTIELGSIPTVSQGEDDGLNHVDGALVLVIPEVARYKIEAGTRITVESEPGVPERNVRLFLLGSAFGALLHQRGMLPLHANAIEIEGRAIAFMGESGSGKSTLAGWFQDRGYNVLADDVCVVGFDDAGKPHAYPGLPRLRLWDETLEALGRDAGRYERSYVGAAGQLDKFDVPIDRSSAACSPTALTAVYLLSRGDEFAIAKLNGVDAAEAIFANTYRGSFLSKVGGQKHHWHSAVRLVQAVPLFRLARAWGLDRLDEQCELILEALRNTASVRF